MNPHEFHLDGYRYALRSQQSGSVTHWVPYRQKLDTGAVEASARSYTTEDEAYNMLVMFGIGLRSELHN